MSTIDGRTGRSVPDLGTLAGTGLRAAVVASQWHQVVMDGLLAGALRGLADAGVDQPEVVRVPGSFELPVACSRLAPDHDLLVALGVVIQGGTPHFDYVCTAATEGITQVAVSTGTPIGFGVLTCGDEQQALARCGIEGSTEDKGYEAAQAAVATVLALRAVGH